MSHGHRTMADIASWMDKGWMDETDDIDVSQPYLQNDSMTGLWRSVYI